MPDKQTSGAEAGGVANPHRVPGRQLVKPLGVHCLNYYLSPSRVIRKVLSVSW